jgi:hypothetical protein
LGLLVTCEPLDSDTDFRSQLEARIGRYAAQRERLNTQLIDLNHALNSLEKRLNAAVEMYRLEFDADPPSLPAGREAPPRRRSVRSQGETWITAIEAVLTEAGQPLHINEIWRRVQERGFQTAAKDPLRAIASVLVRHPAAARTQPNTYALTNGDQPQQSFVTVAGEEPGDQPQEGADE